MSWVALEEEIEFNRDLAEKREAGLDRAEDLVDKTCPPDVGSEEWIAESWDEKVDAELRRIVGEETEPLGPELAEEMRLCLVMDAEERGERLSLCLWAKGLAGELSRLRGEGQGLGWTWDCLMGEVNRDMSEEERERVWSLTSPNLRGLVKTYMKEQRALEKEFLVWGFSEDGHRVSGGLGLGLVQAERCLRKVAGAEELSSLLVRRDLFQRLARDSRNPGKRFRKIAKDCRVAAKAAKKFPRNLSRHRDMGLDLREDAAVLARILHEPDRVLSLSAREDENPLFLENMAGSGLGKDGAEFKETCLRRIMADPEGVPQAMRKVSEAYRRAADGLQEMVLFAEEHGRHERGLEFEPLRHGMSKLPDMEFKEAADVKGPSGPEKRSPGRGSGMEM